MRIYLCVCFFLINHILASENIATLEKSKDVRLLKLIKIRDDINSVINSEIGITESNDWKEDLQHQSSEPDTILDILLLQNELDRQTLKKMPNFVDISKIIHIADSDDLESFKVSTNMIENLTDINAIDFSVRALRLKIRNNDPYKLIRLAKILQSSVLNEPNLEHQTKQSAQLTIDELNYAIGFVALVALNASVCTGDFERNGQLDTLTTDVYLYDPALWESTIEKFIKTNDEQESAKHILNTITSHRFIQQRARGLSALFGKIEKGGNLNSNVTFKIASALHKLRSDDEFKNLNKNEQDEVDKIIEKLPACARNLFFLPYVCLWNKENGNYLTANTDYFNYFADRRYIFSEHHRSARSEWNVNTTAGNEDIFSFSSRPFSNEYLYAAFDYSNDFRYVFNWLPGGADSQSEWNIVLDGDYCYIRSVFFNEYMFSSDIKKHHDDPLVLIRKAHDLVRESKFQWQIRNCD